MSGDRILIHVTGRELGPPQSVILLERIPALRNTFDGAFHVEHLPLDTLLEILHEKSDVQFYVNNGLDGDASIRIDNPSVLEVLEEAMAQLGLKAYGVQREDEYAIYLEPKK